MHKCMFLHSLVSCRPYVSALKFPGSFQLAAPSRNAVALCSQSSQGALPSVTSGFAKLSVSFKLSLIRALESAVHDHTFYLHVVAPARLWDYAGALATASH